MGKITKSLTAIYTALGGKKEDVYRAASVAPVLKKIEELLSGSGKVVPVTAIDLISMYGLILKVNGVEVVALDERKADGTYRGTSEGLTICSTPMKSFELGETGNPSKTIYFVPSHDYVGFIGRNGAISATGDTVEPDGKTLYKAVTSFTAGGSANITKVGL